MAYGLSLAQSSRPTIRPSSYLFRSIEKPGSAACCTSLALQSKTCGTRGGYAMSDLRHEIARRVPLGIRMGGRRLFYWGSSETCDFCGSSVRTYLTNGSDIPVLSRRGVVGGMARPSDRCPVCHAQDRTRLLR